MVPMVQTALAGYAGHDTVKGYGGNDVVDGGTGEDLLIGGTGDDTYVVDNVHDRIIEYSGPRH